MEELCVLVCLNSSTDKQFNLFWSLWLFAVSKGGKVPASDRGQRAWIQGKITWQDEEWLDFDSLLYQTDDELSVFTQNVIKPQLTRSDASFSAGVAFQTWMHRSTLFTKLCQWASGMLKCPWAGFRIYRSCTRTLYSSRTWPLTPPVQTAKKRDVHWGIRLSTKTVWGNLWVISVPHTRQRVRKHSEWALQPAGFESLGWEVHFVGLGQMRLFCSHHKSRNKKETKTTSIHLILPTSPAGTSQSLWPNRK